MSEGFKSKTDIEQEIDNFLRQFDEMEKNDTFRSTFRSTDTKHVEDRFNKISNNFDRNFKKVMPDQDSAGVRRATPQESSFRPSPSRMERYHSDAPRPQASPPQAASHPPYEKSRYQPASETEKKNRRASESRRLKTQPEEKTGFFQKLHAKAVDVLVKLKIMQAPSSEAPGENNMDDTMSTSKHQKRKKKHRLNMKRLFKFALMLCLVMCVLAGGLVAYTVATTPPIDPDKIYEMLSENSVLYDDEGNVVDSLYLNDGLRTNVNYNQLPKNLVNAFVAIEDKTFWKHHGFNFVRIFGAIIEGVTQGERISGTSTITQQLARNLYLAETKSSYSITRKIREAYYTIQLESKLSKEQILEAYLNTIYLGSRSNGVQAASQAYFSKNVEDLNLAECAVLATLPQSPNSFAPVKQDLNEKVDTAGLDIINQGDVYTSWYNDAFLKRQHMVLRFMKEQEYISQSEYDEAMGYNIRESINPYQDNNTDISSYFADYTIKQVLNDLMKENGMSEQDARNMLYNGGLRIYTTMNVKMQQIAETEFASTANFPKVTALNKDSSGNVRDKSNRILLYNMETYFNSDGSFTLQNDEYSKNSDGSLTLYKGKRLNFYNVESQGKSDVNAEFKNLYTLEDSIFYSIGGGVIQIPAEYKHKDMQGNLVISSQFFQDSPGFFINSANGLTVSSEHFTLRQKAMQPQSAMVIMDHRTGDIKAMVGGRSLEGRLLFNRATDATRQPGSSIKPLAVYGPALQSAINGETDWTAASMIEDAQMFVQGKAWPKNWYNGFRGWMTLRKSVEQSVNVNAVKVWQDIGLNRSVDFLEKLGITSIVKSGSVNDMNAAALALGGMSKGISPLEMCAAYSAFANQGSYNEPICYTKVTNKKGDVILENASSAPIQVMDEGVAFIMTDILRTTVSNGIAKGAAIGTQPVAGKTGTTTDNYDAWFVGFTPQYSAAVWIGNDVNIELSEGSSKAAKVWSKIMKQVHEGIPAGTFRKPSNVISVTIDTQSGKLASATSGTAASEYFVKGTEPTTYAPAPTTVSVCSESGYLSTPWCPNTAQHSDGSDLPSTYCNLHNPDISKYPIAEGLQHDTSFKPSETPPDGNHTGTDASGGGSETGTGDGTGTGTGGSTGTGGGTTPPAPPPVIDSGGETDQSTRPDWLNWN